MKLDIRPGSPEGPDWWRHKGGWDRFAASFVEQAINLEAIIDTLRYVRHVREKALRNHQTKFHDCFRKIQTEHRDIELRIKNAMRKYAELKAQVRQVESAMKRGALALSPEEWEKLRKVERRRIARPFTEKLGPPTRTGKKFPNRGLRLRNPELA